MDAFRDSSSSSYRCSYHAFLSFRGQDTRKGFTDHLYRALELARIHTFRDDDEIKRGENIESELDKAIQESQVSIIVFSKDYASSRWCLNELLKIVERKRADRRHVVLPVFYDVDPSDVRKQSGSFAEAFAGHEERFSTEMDKVKQWRRALGDVASTGISLYYEMTDESLQRFKGERNGNEYLINLIDSPGHVDFSSEVTAALRITDGALVVVDCIEGVCVQTETVLRQALGERIRPVLTVNKMDRCFLELQVDGEEAYQTFQRVIENANVIMATYEDPLLGDVQVYPEKGTVAFSAGLHGWAFTLTNFAKMYASKFGVDESKMMERLWGENFFDPATKKWTSKNTGTATCKRGFVQFCYEPIKQIINTCMNDQKDKLWPMLTKLGVTMKSDEKDLMGKALMKRVMQTWLPASTALLDLNNNPITSLPESMNNLVKLRTLAVEGCRNLTMLPELPHGLKQLNGRGCTSLKRITNLPNLDISPAPDPYSCDSDLELSPYNILLDSNLWYCGKLVDVASLFNTLTFTSFDIELLKDIDLFDLKPNGGVKFQGNNYCASRRSKGTFDCAVYSIFLHESKIPDRFNYRSMGNTVFSIIVLSEPNIKIVGLNACILYALQPDRSPDITRGLHVPSLELRNETKGLKWELSHLRFFELSGWILYKSGDILWLSHWIMGNNELECGEEVCFKIKEQDDLLAKEIGVQFVYEQQNKDKDDVPSSSEDALILREISPWRWDVETLDIIDADLLGFTSIYSENGFMSTVVCNLCNHEVIDLENDSRMTP